MWPRSEAEADGAIMAADCCTRERPLSKKILFVGARAIGSYMGAFLSHAGHGRDVVRRGLLPWSGRMNVILG